MLPDGCDGLQSIFNSNKWQKRNWLLFVATMQEHCEFVTGSNLKLFSVFLLLLFSLSFPGLLVEAELGTFCMG